MIELTDPKIQKYLTPYRYEKTSTSWIRNSWCI